MRHAHACWLLLCLPLAVLAAPPAPPAAPVPLHVALIFDDGPVPAHTEALLALFAREQIHVTFGYVAATAARYPAIAQKVAAAGHEIANHSLSHAHPKSLDDAALEREIVGAEKSLTVSAGVAPRWYWSPFLEQDPRLPALAAKAQIDVYSLEHIVVSEDYRAGATADLIRTKATTHLTDGTVVLFHEWPPETVAQMPVIIAELKRQGAVFLTFSELATFRRNQKMVTTTAPAAP
jgi:peptidoglycan/xylan/chitin deacetylase (PgdA/CDA1 family)